MQAHLSLIRSGLVAGFVLAAPFAGHAQGNPSADQIINSLKPGAGMLGRTRGIRPVAPGPAEEAPAAAAPSTPASVSRPYTPPRPTRPSAVASAPAAAPAKPTEGGAPSVNLTVEFATNAAVLTPSAVRTLSELGRALSSPALAAYRFRIEGHTDTVGQPDANKALSERRAEAVVDFLATRFHLDRARLEAAGMGEDGLLVQTPPQTPEARNRRVQIVNIGA
jgi:OOP family OmpA-OmpF porin